MTELTHAPLQGDIEEPDAFEAYCRKVEASDPNYRFPSQRIGTHARFGFQQYKRAKAANRRADAAEREVERLRAVLGMIADRAASIGHYVTTELKEGKP